MEKIRTLAMQWFNPLSSAEKTRLVDTNPELFGGVRRWETLTGSEIENIFYNEVVKKWFYDEPLWVLVKNHQDAINASDSKIKEIYLKEHSKEEPKYDGNGKLISGQPKDEWVSCVGYSAQEYPDFKKGWGIECFNGTKGTVEAYHNPYLYIEGQVDEIHKMNVKAYIAFEQPFYVNKDVEVESFKISWDGSQYKVNIPNYNGGEVVPIEVYNKLKNSQHKVEDNSWDDVEAEYLNSTFYDMEHYNSAFLEFLQQHYTLIKK